MTFLETFGYGSLIIWTLLLFFGVIVSGLDFFLWRSAVADKRTSDAEDFKWDLDNDLSILKNIVLLPALIPFWVVRGLYKTIKSYA